MPSVRTPRKPSPRNLSASLAGAWTASEAPPSISRPLQISTRRRIHRGGVRRRHATDRIADRAVASNVKAHDPDQCAHAIVCDGGGASRGCSATSKTSSTRVNLPIRKCGPRLAHLPPKTAENRRDLGRADPKTPGPNSRPYWPGGRRMDAGSESRLGPSQRAGSQRRRDLSTTPALWLKSRYPQPRLASTTIASDQARRYGQPFLQELAPMIRIAITAEAYEANRETQ